MIGHQLGEVSDMMEWGKLLNPERPRTSTISGDLRVEFERDYDRSVFSTPVKRLQDKAQVFPLEPHDAVRTRLTHSLEVSSVARGLASSACKWLLEHNRSEEHTSELQSPCNLVCRLLLEKKNTHKTCTENIH